MVRRFCKTLLALSSLLVVSSSLLIASSGNKVAASAQELYAPYWTSGAGWETRLLLKNNLATDSLTVTPVLRLASGKEILLDALTISSNASATVLVDEGLLKHAPELLHEPDLYGSIVFRFSAANARNLYADATVSLRDGPIEFHVTAFPTMEFENWPRATGAGSQEGIWWQPRAEEKDVLVVGNSSNKSLSGLLWLSDATGKRWSQPLVLSAHETQRLDLHQLLVSSGLTGTYGGIKLEVSAFAGALRSIHFTYDEAAKTSSFLKMFDRDPAATLRERVGPGDSRPWTMWAPMLALRNPDPTLGLPTGTVLQPTVFVRNATAKTLLVRLALTWRGDSGKGKAKLDEFRMGPFETHQIQIGAMQTQPSIPTSAHWGLVTISSNGAPDDLVAIAASYDATGRYGMETPFSDNLGAHFAGGEWRVDANHNELISLTNGGSHTTDALLTLYYDNGTKKYELQKRIQAGDQMWINVGELIHNRMPDRTGSVLPSEVYSGTYELNELGGGPSANLMLSSLPVDGASGGQNHPPLPTCCGFPSYSVSFVPDPADFYFGDSELVNVDGTDSCNGSRIDISEDFTDWWSGNTSVVTLANQQVHAVGVGATKLYAEGSVYEGQGTNCTWVDAIPLDPTIVFNAQVTSVNIPSDTVTISLTGPAGISGGLVVTWNGPGPNTDIANVTESSGTYTFNPPLGGMQLGKYTGVTAKWTVGGTTATATATYNFKVLGVYKQTQYNTPAESSCSGSPQDITEWNPQCQGTNTTVISGFDFRVTDPVTGTGSGHSISWGDVFQEATCSKGSGDLRGFVTIKGTLGSLSNSTVAACDQNSDLYVPGAQVYIQGEGVKTVTDRCPACCKDTTHLDNYTTNTSCSGVGSLPSALTIRLY